jgi:hypothetical protein
MAERGDRLGQPEEENTAIESTQSASGLSGGTPRNSPAEPDERARRIEAEEQSLTAEPAARPRGKE